MNLTYYNQNNYENIPYPSPSSKGATVKSGGCGVCCMSMIASGLGQTIPPPEMAKISISCKARVSGGTNIQTLAKYLNYTYTTTTSKEQLKSHLQNGGIAVANVGGDRAGYKGVFSDSGHYIVVVKAPSDKLYIFDPGYYKGKYNINGRGQHVTVSGNYVICSLDVLDKDCANRSPRYYLFETLQNQKKEVDKVIYKTLNDVPAWGRPVVDKLIKKGSIKPENGVINVSEDLVRMLVILEREGVLK